MREFLLQLFLCANLTDIVFGSDPVRMQDFFHFGARKSDPIVFPWILHIRFVIDQFIRTDQKKITSTQMMRCIIHGIPPFSTDHKMHDVVVP